MRNEEKNSQPLPGFSFPSNGCQELFLWGWGGRGVRLTAHFHLVPRSKNEWSFMSTPQYAFMAWCSVKEKAQDNFTFTCTFTFTS